MDEYAPGPISIQCVVSGTITYTIQQSNDDPNSPTNPVALGSMTWSSTADTNGVNATTSIMSYFQYGPLWIRINATAGTGTVTATIVQSSVVPY